jgi:RNA polymerase-interacting CarD/CdnL/TRCF family regulator
MDSETIALAYAQKFGAKRSTADVEAQRASFAPPETPDQTAVNLSKSAKFPPEAVALIKSYMGKTVSNARLADMIRKKFDIAASKETVQSEKDKIRGYSTKHSIRARSPSQDFSVASEKRKASHKKSAELADFDFDVRPVKNPLVGKAYFVVGEGVMRYGGKEVKTILGSSMETELLIPCDTTAARMLLRKPPKVFAKLEIRELATHEDFKNVLAKLERGTCRTSLPSSRAGETESVRKLKWDAYLLSGDLSVLADVICARFRDQKRTDNPLIRAADRALDILAIEYAEVHGTSKAAAIQLLYEASGRNDKIAEINKTYGGKGPSAAAE